MEIFANSIDSLLVLGELLTLIITEIQNIRFQELQEKLDPSSGTKPDDDGNLYEPFCFDFDDVYFLSQLKASLNLRDTSALSSTLFRNTISFNIFGLVNELKALINRFRQAEYDYRWNRAKYFNLDMVTQTQEIRSLKKYYNLSLIFLDVLICISSTLLLDPSIEPLILKDNPTAVILENVEPQPMP